MENYGNELVDRRIWIGEAARKGVSN